MIEYGDHWQHAVAVSCGDSVSTSSCWWLIPEGLVRKIEELTVPDKLHMCRQLLCQCVERLQWHGRDLVNINDGAARKCSQHILQFASLVCCEPPAGILHTFRLVCTKRLRGSTRGSRTQERLQPMRDGAKRQATLLVAATGHKSGRQRARNGTVARTRFEQTVRSAA